MAGRGYRDRGVRRRIAVLTLKATKQYTATAKLLFTQNQLLTEVGGTAPSPSADPQADQATNLLLVATNEVATAVKQTLRSPLSVSELLDEVTTATDQTSNIVDVPRPIPTRPRPRPSPMRSPTST